jgi:hypothetical protein
MLLVHMTLHTAAVVSTSSLMLLAETPQYVISHVLVNVATAAATAVVVTAATVVTAAAVNTAVTVATITVIILEDTAVAVTFTVTAAAAVPACTTVTSSQCIGQLSEETQQLVEPAEHQLDDTLSYQQRNTS